ncbi:MAG: thiamine phosphate synthase [Planctomycetota bacterium]
MERSAYRIIDANFNRAREAARVIEEFCRFALNSTPLSKRAKQLRHELSAAIRRLDAGRLISSRDTLGDVGLGQIVNNQLARGDLNDCLVAGCKRLTEALRAIAEVSGIEDLALAKTIEALRYDAYTLEKDVILFADAYGRFNRVSLYIVITSDLPVEILSLTQKCAAGGADCIQMRAKNIEDDKLYGLAFEFTGICRESGVLSVINDRADIAVAAGADGLHLGQNDLPVAQARKLQLAPLIIGKSTHSLEQLRAACEELPTYVGLGPVHATATKPTAPAVGLEYIRRGTELLADTGIGHVAIGGITIDNVDEVLNAGAGCIAVCAAVTKAADPTAACRALKDKIERFGKD